MKHYRNLTGTQVPQGRGVSWYSLSDLIGAGAGCPLWTDALPAFADSKTQTIRTTVIWMMAGGAGDILVAGQDRIVKKKPTELCLIGIEWFEIRGLQRRGKIGCIGGRTDCERQKKGKPMRHLVAAIALVSAGPALAEIETARDFMDAGNYAAAMEELLPAANSGNAEAEELIGVMYALGLGVAQDDQRAFEWYLRAALKGHAGAQSGVGWYYEVGRGIEAPDLIRAYMWYVLSTVGGDPDAAVSQEEVIKKMTPEQIEKALVLVEDYRTWLYPFR